MLTIKITSSMEHKTSALCVTVKTTRIVDVIKPCLKIGGKMLNFMEISIYRPPR